VSDDIQHELNNTNDFSDLQQGDTFNMTINS